MKCSASELLSVLPILDMSSEIVIPGFDPEGRMAQEVAALSARRVVMDLLSTGADDAITEAATVVHHKAFNSAYPGTFKLK